MHQCIWFRLVDSADQTNLNGPKEDVLEHRLSQTEHRLVSFDLGFYFRFVCSFSPQTD